MSEQDVWADSLLGYVEVCPEMREYDIFDMSDTSILW
jgi:hypothetical protein